jgi:hypothetical protein
VGSRSRPNIHFEYILPLQVGFGASASFSGKEEFGFERYVWDTRGWTDCSRTCGTGKITQRILSWRYVWHTKTCRCSTGQDSWETFGMGEITER